MLYSLLCGSNTGGVSEMEMMAGCNRFGVDNPVPVITKRLALYGNEETTIRLAEEMQKEMAK